MVKFARCCNPLPGDPVIGFVTKGFGISIHKQDCPNVMQNRSTPENADRWKEAHWESAAEEAGTGSSIYEALLQIHADDRIGMLADITAALADMRVSILSINVLNCNDGRYINLKVGCRNIDHCSSIVSRLKSLKGVDYITRGFS